RNSLVKAVTVISIVILLAGIAAITPRSGFGQNGPPDRGVIVVNTPLPVSGAIGVNGTVSAAQSGTWNVGITGTPNVGITGTPAVSSGDQTKLVGSFAGAPAGNNAFTEVVNADVGQYRSVRVLTNCFAGGACGNIAVNVYSIV